MADKMVASKVDSTAAMKADSWVMRMVEQMVAL